MSWVSKVIAAALENVNGLAFLVGACWLYVGLAGISRPAADVTAGMVLMAIGAFPYLRRKRKP